MAESDFDHFDAYDAHRVRERAPVRRGGRVQAWVNGAGAVTSVALIVGLGVWGYNLAVRDVQGVPVIRALEGPARIAPEDPGGELALHQGMAVNEIAADGTAGDPADRLRLAPRVEGLAEADQAMGALAGARAADSATAAPVPDGTGSVLPAPDFAEVRPDEPLPDGPVEPIVEPLVADIAAAPAPYVALDVISPDIAGVARSPRPLRRPGSAVEFERDAMAEAAAAAVAEALALPLALDISASAVPRGTQLVQIGSYPDEAEARLEWDKAAARFGGLMHDKRRVIEPAESGGQLFYRLRVEGFSDLDDARRFCAALKAENAECVPAAVR